jgi:hypothetical protein
VLSVMVLFSLVSGYCFWCWLFGSKICGLFNSLIRKHNHE